MQPDCGIRLYIFQIWLEFTIAIKVFVTCKKASPRKPHGNLILSLPLYKYCIKFGIRDYARFFLHNSVWLTNVATLGSLWACRIRVAAFAHDTVGITCINVNAVVVITTITSNYHPHCNARSMFALHQVCVTNGTCLRYIRDMFQVATTKPPLPYLLHFVVVFQLGKRGNMSFQSLDNCLSLIRLFSPCRDTIMIVWLFLAKQAERTGSAAAEALAHKT